MAKTFNRYLGGKGGGGAAANIYVTGLSQDDLVTMRTPSGKVVNGEWGEVVRYKAYENPIMASNNEQGVKITYSSNDSRSSKPWNITNPSVSESYDNNWMSTAYSNGWVMYEFNTPFIADRCFIKPYYGLGSSGYASLGTYKILASVDGVNFDTIVPLKTYSNGASGEEIPLSLNTAYKYYRVEIPTSGGNGATLYVGLSVLQFSGVIPKTLQAYTFHATEYGMYTITASNSVKTSTEEVLVDALMDYWVAMYRTMTAVIDLSNSNPATCVRYEDDAEDLVAGSDDWDEFFGHYPCLFKDGAEIGRLQRDNFDLFENGTTADISSGDSGDVMIAFPRRGLTIETIGNELRISMTDAPNAEGFEYNAHQRGTEDKDIFYLGTYNGYVLNNKLRSLKGKSITVSRNLSQFRTLAQANGSGYEQSAFYQLTFRQCMYILKYKNLNSQSTVSIGYVLSTYVSPIATGGTEAYGMDCEIIKSTNPSFITGQNHHVKLFGIEDFWGNAWEWVDGLVSDSSRNILTANSDFNDSGSGYTNNGNGGVTSDIGRSYLSKPQGSTKAGFVAKAVGGSASTYFCDFAYLYASSAAIFGGGHWDDVTAPGIFRIQLSNNAAQPDAGITSRLMYL